MDAALLTWLQENADALDTTPGLAGEVVPRPAAAGLLRAGVPVECGGAGGTVADAIAAIADVAAYSLAAAFVLWGQRTFIAYLLHSPNAALRARVLAWPASRSCCLPTNRFRRWRRSSPAR